MLDIDSEVSEGTEKDESGGRIVVSVAGNGERMNESSPARRAANKT